MAESDQNNILIQQQSIPPDVAVATNQDDASIKGEPKKGFAPSNISRLREEAPEIFDIAVKKAIQHQMFYSLRRSGNRIRQAMKKARKEAERNR